MLDVREVDVSEIQRHEEATEADVRLGGEGMDACCRTSEFRCFRGVLEQSDVDRLFLLPGFKDVTTGASCRIRDLIPDAATLERSLQFVSEKVDLRSQHGLALVLVCEDLHTAPFIIIDGNHRAIAQYFTHGGLQDVYAYVCVHQALSQWSVVPPLARVTKGQTEPRAAPEEGDDQAGRETTR
jgi:hypothetical protein